MQETARLHMNGPSRREIITQVKNAFDDLFGEGGYEIEEIEYSPGARGLNSEVVWWESQSTARKTSSTGGFRQ